MSRFTAQRGNILFLILLAVVLFAALSYAVTQGMRGGGNDASNEKGQAQTAELLNYFAQMDAAVQRMMVTGDVKDYELNFYYQSNNNYVSGTYDNTNCTESRCRVFDPAGGGVSGRSAGPYSRPGNALAKIVLLSVPGVGTPAPDLVYIVVSAKTNICLEINKQIGLSDMVYSATHSLSSNVLYENAFAGGAYGTTTISAGAPITQAMGLARTYCACPLGDRTSCEASQWPLIYHVLVAR